MLLADGALGHCSPRGLALCGAGPRPFDRGARMVELLKQGQYKPFDVIDQCISIFAASRGFLDDIPVPSVPKFEDGLLSYFRAQKADLRAKLATAKSFKGIEDEFKAAVAQYKSGFKA
ncbi:MAG: hypothetical protein ACK5WX_01425 [bacterium]